MARFITFGFLLVLLIFSGHDDRKRVRFAEAKDCHKVWNCRGYDRCREDCQNRFAGRGACDLYTAPPVPKQCFCAYHC
ncbi:putative defensin-like protein 184 [Punica granatum]|uniref:Uncharacterized protein n=2 Tax=Punica granatum TaxID=22663 RepID=A0A218XAL1_PUNGR|nr:putative defensin-like protein 184 [Punica granatum]OWM81997.1 hypothetical protein CDL15_Pgr001570 [Punica granatum]PKI44668.1 hypothetical protein CRG98_035023 [Punica granatum]